MNTVTVLDDPYPLPNTECCLCNAPGSFAIGRLFFLKEFRFTNASWPVPRVKVNE